MEDGDLCAWSCGSGTLLHIQRMNPWQQKVQKIINWPACSSVTEFQGFLGVFGLVRIWVKDFTKKARPLVDLMKKDLDFFWDLAQDDTMADLKEAVITAPCLRPINYLCLWPVILAVDSSYIAVGFILLQLGADGKQYPSCFRSIMWNEWESHYSQPKIEIYGLWRALWALQIHIISMQNLIVEVDVQYIKGMLNNPDI